MPLQLHKIFVPYRILTFEKRKWSTFQSILKKIKVTFDVNQNADAPLSKQKSKRKPMEKIKLWINYITTPKNFKMALCSHLIFKKFE